MVQENKVKGFFAYASLPESLAETIEVAIRKMNESGYVNIQSWRELNINGKSVVSEICQEIDAADLFLCDLTHLNPNVLFELGYAISKNKRVWICLDNSFPNAVIEYSKFKILTGIGYAKYTNSDLLVEEFLKDQPFSLLEKTLYKSHIEPVLESCLAAQKILYLKSPIETEASKELSKLLRASRISLSLDDPSEVPIQTIEWYVEHIVESIAVVAHLLDKDRSAGFGTQNAKYSFVAGLAKGMGKHLLLLAHSPYSAPFDYQNLLKVHKNASECRDFAKNWLDPIEGEFYQEREIIASVRKSKKDVISLRKIYLGDCTAENEQNELKNYYIETASFNEAMMAANQSIIFVGSKGTGKTATLLRIKQPFFCKYESEISTVL